ncbi:MAG: glycosyltransferase family 2 protein [Candidatus Cohnella colombiensis]|uniref:Glycosyltransferase family 2 protein n=1 Tax=Candidatus Cohnella colombiensis TaxID=3121368 RepID=A0AA95EV08_9BACL|nr:MAG: glycosyltransferase family 2 protein [Cohnella sp.]
MTNNLISLCMIVKNEEKTLERCLSSVYRYLDEIIIVDTGSTDRTIEIAKRYTDHIYHFTWVNDFSVARNESLKYATSKWILYMDADDYMEEKDIASLRELLSELIPQPDLVYQIPYTSLLSNQATGPMNITPAIRVFPNHMDLQFHRPIHEQLQSERGIPLRAADIKIPIYHTGYTPTEMEEKKKHERNLSIFNELKETTGFNAYDYFTLGNQYLVMKEYDKALNAYQSSLDTTSSRNVWLKPLLLSMLETLIKQGKFIEAWTFTETQMEPCLEYSDARCIIGTVLHALGFWEKSKIEFLTAIDLAEKRLNNKQDPYILSPEYSMVIPLKYLANIYERESNISQSTYYFTKYIMVNPQDIEALSKLVELLSLSGSVETTTSLLEQLLEVGTDALKAATLTKISLSLGDRELTSYYIKKYDILNHLAPYDRLRYYLLFNNKIDFERELALCTPSHKEHPSFIKHLLLGAIVWNEADWSNTFSIDPEHESYPYWSITTNIINNQYNKQDPNSIAVYYDVLTELYTLQQDSAYDQLIDLLSTPELINQIASYFYTKHHYEIAEQYHSYLIENNELNTDNSIRLAFKNLGQGNIQDTLMFLEYTLTLKPKSKDIYILYCTLCNDPTAREEKKNKLLQIAPEYNSLSLFHTF